MFAYRLAVNWFGSVRVTDYPSERLPPGLSQAGSIVIEVFAEFALLSDNLFEVPLQQWLNTNVE